MAGERSPVNGQPLPKGKPFTSESAREARQKRTEKERAKISVTSAILRVMAEDIKTVGGQSISTAEAVARGIIKKAIAGDSKMVELLLDVLGEKPAAQVQVSAIDKTVKDDVDRLISEALEDGTDT